MEETDIRWLRNEVILNTVAVPRSDVPKANICQENRKVNFTIYYSSFKLIDR